MIIFKNRASAILFDVLKSIDNNKPFILPANVCPIVVATFLKAGVNFEFVDISKKTLCINEEIILKKIKEFPNFYNGILFVRSYGTEGNFKDFFKKVKDINSDIFIIDDCCLNIPKFKNIKTENVDMTLFSTGYSKFADIDFGGFAYIRDDFSYNSRNLTYSKSKLEELVSQFKNVISRNKKFNYEDTNWLDTSKPKISFSQYKNIINKKIISIKKRKKKLNDIYSTRLPNKIQLKSKYQNWRFNILVPQKKELLDKIFSRNLFASSHYASLDGIFSDGKSINAEKLSSYIVNLFNDKRFNEEKAEKISRIISDHCKINGVQNAEIKEFDLVKK